MRIVHVYDGHERIHGGRGSVPNVVWNVARETARAGHDVSVIERQWDGLPATATHEGVSFRRLALRTGASEPWTRIPYQQVHSPVGLARLIVDRTNFARGALGALWGREYDVLHVHLPFAANVMVALAPWLRRRTVYTAHLGELRLDLLADGGVGESTAVSDASGDSTAVSDASGDSTPDVPGVLSAFSPDDFLAKRAAATTVLNPTIEEALGERGVPPERLSVVPNGVDVGRFGTVDAASRERVRAEYGLGDGPTVLFVGTIMPRKGVTELIEALGGVVEETGVAPNVVLAGERELDEEYTSQVERLIVSNRLESTISMPGFIPEEDLPALYALADVFVVPSLEEGFGMTAVEAMAAGTAVVATRVGGLPHVLEGGTHGRLVDPGDVDGLSAALAELLTDPEERATLAERASERAREFSWEGVADRFEGIYQEVLS